MYEVKGTGIGLATMSDLKNRQKETLDATARARVYLLNDGQPVAGLVSLQMMELLEIGEPRGELVAQDLEFALRGARAQQAVHHGQ